MKRRNRWGLSLAVIISMVLVGLWAVGVRPSVLLMRVRYGGGVERVAAGFLDSLGTSVCQERLAGIGLSQARVTAICAHEARRPVSNRRLLACTTEHGNLRLQYTFRDTTLSTDSELFLWVRRDGANWHVYGYARSY
jgi:hypothetical protein